MQLGMQQSKYNNIGCKTANENKIITIRWCKIKDFQLRTLSDLLFVTAIISNFEKSVQVIK